MRIRHLIIVGAAVALSAWALRDAAIAVWLSAEAAGPPAIVRGDVRAKLTTLEVEFLPDGIPAPAQAQKVASLARTILRSAPLEASALRDLALASQRLGDAASTGQLVLTERLSRRDLPTQNALLRLAAQNGQYVPALVHLDRILSVYPDNLDKFVDAMAALAVDPVGRPILARYGKRPWFASFVARAVGQVDDPRDVAALLLAAHMPPSSLSAQFGPFLLGRLISAGDYPAAREFAIRFASAPPAALDDFGLNTSTADPRWAPLSWQLLSNAMVDARLDDRGGLQADVEPDAVTVIAQRVTTLPTGAYELEQQIAPGRGWEHLRLRWELGCEGPRGSTAPVWRQPVPLGPQTVHYRTRLEIPSDCHAQHWRLIAAIEDSQLSAGFRLDNLVLRRTPIGELPQPTTGLGDRRKNDTANGA